MRGSGGGRRCVPPPAPNLLLVERVANRAADRVGQHSVSEEMRGASRAACQPKKGFTALVTAACAASHMIPTVQPLSHKLNSYGDRRGRLKSSPQSHAVRGGSLAFNLILALGKTLFPSRPPPSPHPPVTNQFTCITRHVKSCQQSGLTHSHSTPNAAHATNAGGER